MNENQFFKAYCRRLCRDLEKIEQQLENIEPALALEMVKELKSDLQKDME